MYDYNYYIRFLTTQLMIRERFIKTHGVQSLNLYETSIINVSGVRGGGVTSAICMMFNPSTDIYVGVNRNICNTVENFVNKKIYGEINDYKSRSIGSYKYLSFGNVNFSNININSEVLSKHIGDYFEDNDIELLKYKMDTITFSRKKPKIKIEQVDTERATRDIVNSITNNIPNDDNFSLEHIKSVLHEYNDKKLVRVFIDLGSDLQRKNSIAINKLIEFFNSYILTDVVFILS